ncbi:hypothetical protein PP1Y_AT13183 [Novosphingobium sp. PP1Y]|nr:hypothetical protein PP1Y_AT13183 [Novosphingobium sp. PP1Y]
MDHLPKMPNASAPIAQVLAKVFAMINSYFAYQFSSHDNSRRKGEGCGGPKVLSGHEWED